jgi:capsular polysaccharide export protein
MIVLSFSEFQPAHDLRTEKNAMLNRGPEVYRGRRVLLLQGPVGPFFRLFAEDLRTAGAVVHKIDFCGGDQWFAPAGSIPFRGSAAEWPDFFAAQLDSLKIDVLLFFGDCRALHVTARELALKRGIEVGVFEEGYIRPDFITLERGGVNGFSGLPRDPDFYRQQPVSQPPTREVGRYFWQAAKWAMLYYAASNLLQMFYPHYRHHRPLTVLDGLPWVRSFWRKRHYARRERGMVPLLTGAWSGKYFLLPLQVHNDAQIRVHTHYDTVIDFIDLVMRSFAQHAPADRFLVIKHHPMDRGYYDYRLCITEIADELGITARVRYLHDQHLPTLFDHACGVVVANSTVGLSAIHHGLPVKACRSAIYDMSGLTWQGDLDSFWPAAGAFRPDHALYVHFRAHVVRTTQINGSFYKPMLIPGSRAGLAYNARFMEAVASAAVQKPPPVTPRETAAVPDYPLTLARIATE